MNYQQLMQQNQANQEIKDCIDLYNDLQKLMRETRKEAGNSQQAEIELINQERQRQQLLKLIAVKLNEFPVFDGE